MLTSTWKTYPKLGKRNKGCGQNSCLCTRRRRLSPFHYEFTGIIKGAKILEQVDMDMLQFVDEDFDIEISDELYHQGLSSVVVNREPASIEQAATDSVRRATATGRILRLPHRFRR